MPFLGPSPSQPGLGASTIDSTFDSGLKSDGFHEGGARIVHPSAGLARHTNFGTTLRILRSREQAEPMSLTWLRVEQLIASVLNDRKATLGNNERNLIAAKLTSVIRTAVHSPLNNIFFLYDFFCGKIFYRRTRVAFRKSYTHRINRSNGSDQWCFDTHR